MKLHERFENERGVSPVVGVALLIAMTVILAAVIGYVVLGMNATGAESPQATFAYDYDGTEVHITHEGGDKLNAEHITVYIDGAENTLNEDMTAGSTESFSATEDDTVRIVWNDPNSDQTNVIGQHTV